MSTPVRTPIGTGKTCTAISYTELVVDRRLQHTYSCLDSLPCTIDYNQIYDAIISGKLVMIGIPVIDHRQICNVIMKSKVNVSMPLSYDKSQEREFAVLKNTG